MIESIIISNHNKIRDFFFFSLSLYIIRLALKSNKIPNLK